MSNGQASPAALDLMITWPKLPPARRPTSQPPARSGSGYRPGLAGYVDKLECDLERAEARIADLEAELAQRPPPARDAVSPTARAKARSARLPEAPLGVPGGTLEPRAGRLRLGGAEVRLSPSEALVLVTLATANGRWLSRGALAARTGMPTGATSTVLSRLQGKVRAAGVEPGSLLEYVAGRGYRLAGGRDGQRPC